MLRASRVAKQRQLHARDTEGLRQRRRLRNDRRHGKVPIAKPLPIIESDPVPKPEIKPITKDTIVKVVPVSNYEDHIKREMMQRRRKREMRRNKNR